MSAAFKNYYDTLGVASDASDAEIKKAFRDLARKHHPDVAKDKSDTGDRFKEINEANEVLSDPEKRRKYDELGANWNHPERQEAAHGGGFGAGAEAGDEFHFDGTGFSDFFEQFFGSRGQRAGGFGSARETAAENREIYHRGQDVEGDILVTLDEVLHGSERTIRQQRTDRRTGETATQTLRVKIPSGVREAQLIRLAGKGRDGMGGAEAGHLYLRVVFAKHPEFRVRDANLYHDLELAPWAAVLGGSVRVPTLDGTVALRIPPDTRAGREFRLRGLGLPGTNGARGDLHVRVSIQIPPRITPAERVLWEKLAAASASQPENAS